MSHSKPTKKTKRNSAEATSRPATPVRVSSESGRATLPVSEGTPAQKRLVAAVCLGLVLACVAVYGQTLWFSFVNYDDNLYILETPQVQAGLTLKGIVWAFVTEKALYFHPLTWISLMLDCSLYGLHAGGHHITNLLFHAGGTVFLFLALRLMTGALWPSAAVAALFAVHPLNAESVAWVAERKGVLSGFFWMLALYTYGLYVRRGGKLRYAAVALAFAGGLMSKPMVLTLPCALLLLDLWPLGRLNFADPPAVTARKAVRLVVEKIPLFMLTALSVLSTLIMQSRGHNIDVEGKISLATRVANAIVVYALYLVKTVCPTGLAAFYPYPDSRPLWQVGGAFLVLAAITAICLLQARRRPYLIAGWAWYLGTFALVIGIIRIGDFSHADRYTYLPMVGVFWMLVWGLVDLAAALKVPRRAVAAAGCTAIAALTVCGFIQTAYWRNDWTLFSHAVDVGEESCTAYSNMGMAAKEQGRIEDAKKYLKKSLELNPKFVAPINHLGLIAMDEGHLDEAAAYMKQVLDLNSKEVNALNNLALIYMQQGRNNEAETCLTKAIELRPDDTNALNNLGKLYRDMGRYEDARTALNKALGLKPGHANALINLGAVALSEKKYDEARSCLNKALSAEPGNLSALTTLSEVAEAQGLHDEAQQYLAKAQEMNPNNATALYNLGKTAMDKGRYEEAKTYLQKALAADPKSTAALNGLGMIAVNQGRFDEAVPHLKKALEVDPKNVEVLYNLGLAAKGQKQYDEAKACLNKVLELDPKNVKALNNLAVLAMEQGNNDEAVAFLKKALEIKPDHVNALTNLGKIEMDKKAYDEAKTYLKKAIELDPKTVPARLNLGLCLLNQEQNEEAAAAFRKVLEMDPQYIRAMRPLAAALAKLGRQEEADSLIKKATELEQARAGK